MGALFWFRPGFDLRLPGNVYLFGAGCDSPASYAHTGWEHRDDVQPGGVFHTRTLVSAHYRLGIGWF
jgi:hypothetical protein